MLIHELTHIILCTIIAIIGYRYLRSYWVWIASYLMGFLLDSDHLVDYFLYRKGLLFNLKEFASGTYFEIAGKIYLFLHSYELAILFIIAASIIWFVTQKPWRKKAVTILLVLAFSLILHLLYDTIYYKPDWNTYFLLSRIYHHFNLSDFHFH